jgi:four helix bundle protein
MGLNLACAVRSVGSMAHKLEELPIYHKAVAFWSAVNALLETPRLRRNRKLHEQISEANDSITANMVEGFEQGTDRAFANFLSYSKGSLAEVLRRLKQARFKNLISEEQLAPFLGPGEELGKMLGGFIKYLRNCGWNDRGSHGSSE